MPDDTAFEIALAATLGPPARDEDHLFVKRVSQRIRLEEHLRGERADAVGGLVMQLVSVAAIAGAFAALGLSGTIRGAIRELPHLGLALVLVVFASWIALLVSGQRRVPTFTILNRR